MYFNVKDLIDKGVVKLTHCISDEMIADFFTKPIQGRKFAIMRDIISNLQSSGEHRSVLVDNSENCLPEGLKEKT
jgi:hypothetical protein